jgi:hypothetical protein
MGTVSRRPCDLTVTFDDGSSTQCHALILEYARQQQALFLVAS